MIATVLFAAMLTAEAQSLITSPRVCPGSTGNKISVSNLPANYCLGWWRDSGLAQGSCNPYSGSPTYYTATNTQGRYIVKTAYYPCSWKLLSQFVGPFFSSALLGGKTKFLSTYVRVGYPEPRVPQLAWCSGGTRSITIGGLEYNAEDCFFSEYYRYELPSGWTSDCIPLEDYSCDPFVTKRKTISVTTPSNLANGVYVIKVRAVYDNNQPLPNYPPGEIRIHVGAPPAPSSTISAWFSRSQTHGYDFTLCSGDDTWFHTNDIVDTPVPYTVEWEASGAVSLSNSSPNKVNHAVRVVASGTGSGSIRVRYTNSCGSSAWVSKSIKVNMCESQKLPGGFTGFNPSTDPELAQHNTTRAYPLYKDVFDVLHLAFMTPSAAADTIFSVDHQMGFDYTVTLKKLGASSPSLVSTAQTKQYTAIDVSGLQVGDYQVRVENSIVYQLDTVKIWSSCAGSCFMGIGQSGPCKLEPLVYPIPGSSNMTVDFVDNSGLDPSPSHNIGFSYELKIYDLQGVEKLSHSSSFQRSNFSVAGLNIGNYIVKISDGVNVYNVNYIKQ